MTTSLRAALALLADQGERASREVRVHRWHAVHEASDATATAPRGRARAG